MESARLVADVVSEGQASDIVVLDIREACDFADYFVILTAESARQMRAVAEEIEQSMERATVGLHHREGTPRSGWMLLDFGTLSSTSSLPSSVTFTSWRTPGPTPEKSSGFCDPPVAISGIVQKLLGREE